MILIVLSGFIIALLLVPLGHLLKGRLSILFSLLPLSLFTYFASFLSKVAAGQSLTFHYSWVPSMHIDLSFNLDGLSLLFCLLITGIGAFVFMYAAAYLKGHLYLDRFFGYLSFFMASMLGLVLSDNILSLFIFWELTSISSFYLIGFNNNDAASRKSSLLALAITGGGGFLLLAGFIIMGSLTGTYSIKEMIAQASLLKMHSLYPLILTFIFCGAFTKSAQFPFHFWLPGAMKAPTPVSAYLHSATMVKAGIYLIARFTPVLGNHSYWNTTLIIVGGITMLYAGFHAVFRTDLKSILAFSTIAALGILVFLLGIGTEQALLAAAVFLLVHALYKAALFLIAGVIDHETGTRDVTILGGLRKVLLPLAIAGALAAFSNAGIPLTFGFLGKDLIYEATLNTVSFGVVLTIAAIITNVFLLYAGFVAGIKPFTGALPAVHQKVHMPSILMWVPPLLLALGGLIFGVIPALVDAPLIQPAVLAIHGSVVAIPLKLWHGFNLVLLLSVITLAAGFLMYYFLKPSTSKLEAIEHWKSISPHSLATRSASKFISFSYTITKILQNGYLRLYLLVILVFSVCLLAYKLFTGVNIYINKEQLSQLTAYEIMITGVMLMAVLKVISTRSRLTAVTSMGVVGYCLCLLFVFYSAPDLAMTQFTIETLTVVLFVLVLFKLPPFLQFTNTKVKIRDGIVALAFGSLITIIALEVLNEPVNKEISQFYGDNAYLLAKGKNVVNVILVDFRGLDTLVEITVLTIAALGVYGLLKLQNISHQKDNI